VNGICETSSRPLRRRANRQQGGNSTPTVQSELLPINCRAYLEKAGDHARARVVAAGLRLAMLLGAKPDATPADDAPADAGFDFDLPRPTAPAPTPAAEATATLGYWLNTKGGVRHNSGCRWYQNTKRGRDCGPNDGRPCGLCGG
jgi:hypothetical protein